MMGFLHMLFAVALTLRAISTTFRSKEAMVPLRSCGMTIIHMTVSFLLSWETDFMIVATRLSALPWPFMCLGMLPVWLR
jgi:hypothetical protein